MSKKTIALTGLALVAMAGLAYAADLPGISRPYAAPAPAYATYNWMGPYIGANLGYLWGEVTRDGTEPSGGVLGAQLGYNWQSGQFVLGVETDLQGSNADDTTGARNFSNSWFGTTRGRVGYAMNNVLVYGTGGLAYGNLELTTAGLSESQVAFGWALGAGAEVGLVPNWTARVEYLYFDLANQRYLTGTTHGLEANVLRAGLNYRF